MSSNPSSTCANNGSVKSSTTHNTESVSGNPSTSSSASSPASSSASSTVAGDASNLAAEQIAAFIEHPIDANPSYANTATEASIAEHTAAMHSVIEDFDTIMARNAAADEEEGEGEGKEHNQK